MSIDTLNGVVGQAAHFAGDYLFRKAALPNNATIHSGEHILNNTLGKLLLIGTIDKNLSLTGTNALTVLLQYKDGKHYEKLEHVPQSAKSGRRSRLRYSRMPVVQLSKQYPSSLHLFFACE